MGSTVQEDSNVIQNMQCSTTVAAPVTTAVTLVTTSAPVTTTTVGQMPPTLLGTTQVTDVGVTNPGTMATDPGTAVTNSNTMVPTSVVHDAPGQGAPSPPPPTEALDPAAPSPTTPAVTTPAVTTPAVTTPAVTTPAVTTPAVTTPAVTTPVATTLATSEQQRAACLIAIEADGELDLISSSYRFFQRKEKPSATNWFESMYSELSIMLIHWSKLSHLIFYKRKSNLRKVYQPLYSIQYILQSRSNIVHLSSSKSS